MKKILALAILLGLTAGAGAQTFPLNNIPVGKGPGKQGWTPLAPGAENACLMIISGVPTFSTCPGAGTGGTVTSVTSGLGLTGTPSPITTSGSIAVNAPSCSTSVSVLQWTTGVGFGCSTTNPAGYVVGPASAVADRVASYNGTTGKIIKDSGIPTSGLPTAAGQIPGVTSNTAATAGNVGEIVEAEVTFAARSAMSCQSIPNSVMQSISITAGEWDCSGNHGFETNTGALAAEYHYEISTTGSSSLVTAPNKGCTQGTHALYIANQGQVFPNGPCRLSVAGTTTIFQKSYSKWGTNAGVGDNCSGGQTRYGYLRCTRVH